MAVSEINGFCSQVMLLDPDTGERHYYRTSPNQAGGSLAFGGPYAAWLGPTLVELWRDDLVRTIQYGDLPNPPKPNAAHTGCTFTDHRAGRRPVRHRRALRRARVPNAQVVINWATPDSAPDKPDGQDVFKHDPRARRSTPARRPPGSSGSPPTGSPCWCRRRSRPSSSTTPPVRRPRRTPVDIPADAIVAADRLTADRRHGAHPGRSGRRLPLLTDRRPAAGGDQPEHRGCPAPPRPRPPRPSPSSSLRRPGCSRRRDHRFGRLRHRRKQSQVKDLTVLWTKTGALGLPAVVGDQLLMPVDGGLSVFTAANGNPGVVPAAIPVDRGGYPGRVDAAAVGEMIIETRGDAGRRDSAVRRRDHARSRTAHAHVRGPGRRCPARPDRWPRWTPTRHVGRAGTVLLLPGYTGSKEDFAPILDPLAASRFPGRRHRPARAVRITRPRRRERLHATALGLVCAAVVADLTATARWSCSAIPSAVWSPAGAVLAGAPVSGLILLCSGPAALPRRAAPGLAASPASRCCAHTARRWSTTAPSPSAGRPASRSPPTSPHCSARRFLASSPAGLLGMGAALQTEPDRVDQLQRALVIATGTPVAVDRRRRGRRLADRPPGRHGASGSGPS